MDTGAHNLARLPTATDDNARAPADRHRVRYRAADALRREINSWVSELEHYSDHFTDAETGKIAELLKLSRALHRSLSKREGERRLRRGQREAGSSYPKARKSQR
jgi:hypothetical protein